MTAMRTRHLTPEEFINALETSSGAAAAHLADCEICQTELTAMRAMMTDVMAAGDVPEPSPLFWPHLRARVRDGVGDEPPSSPHWLFSLWRPVLAGAASLAVVALVLWRTAAPELRDAHHEAPLVATVTTSESQTAILSPEAASLLDAMAATTPRLRMDDVRAAGLAPSPAATSAAIEDLTPEQREELVRLIRVELGTF